ncbi:hypothetical protein [Streptomyces xantholiticus]|uniref:hypothetical protein n=1 Tax=Streptomyces xantholiticus TaxID=68285 RepID=UPI001E583D5D|nr:hypothetical protein [Streptomyces xantholiticus]
MADLVDAGTGTTAELEAVGVQGRFALVRLPYDSPSATCVARGAKAAGALAVIVHRAAPGRWLPSTVTLRTELTDAKGNSVSQLVIGAYAVR